MKWIRWWGVIAFAATVAVIAVLWLVLIDLFIKWSIERVGTALVGAKVELEEADLTIFPLGLTLTGIRVANPREPMTNAVEARRCAFLIDGVSALRRKVIIEDMSVEGIRLNTPRRTSGAVSKAPEREKEEEEKRMAERFRLPAFEVPDVSEALAREDLRSLRLAEEVKAGLAEDKERLEGELKGLLDKKKIEEYRARFETLKGARKDGLGGVLGSTGEFISLRNDIKEDLNKVRSAKEDLAGTLAAYRKKLAEAEKAPFEDIDRIKRKYALTPEGLANMASALLGQTIAGYADSAVRWYRRLEPIVRKVAERKDGVEVEKPVRGKGVDVRFPEYRPSPDFLVSRAALSAEIPAGVISGRVTDLTNDQEVLGRPTRFDFAGEGLKGLDSLKLTGELNRVRPGDTKDSVDMKLRGYRVSGFDIAKGQNFPVVVNRALSDIDLGVVVRGSGLDAEVRAGFSAVEIKAGRAEGMGAVEGAVASALAGVKDFNLKAGVTGTLADYDITLSSDLDRVLKSAVGKAASAQAAEFERRLKTAVLEKTAGPLKELKGGFAGLQSVEGELGERVKFADGLLEEIGEAAMGGVKLPKLPF